MFALTVFGRFIVKRGVTEPELCADPTDLRLLALDFLGHLKQRRAVNGRRRGERISDSSVTNMLGNVEQF